MNVLMAHAKDLWLCYTKKKMLRRKKKSMKRFFNGGKICEACVAFRELIVLTSPCRFLMKLIIVMDSRFFLRFFSGIVIINYFHNSLIFSASIFGIYWNQIGSWWLRHISHYNVFQPFDEGILMWFTTTYKILLNFIAILL